MPVVQPVLGTVRNTYIYIYIIYDHGGKSMPIDNYEQYKREINQITGRLYIYTREREREKKKKKKKRERRRRRRKEGRKEGWKERKKKRKMKEKPSK